MKRGQTWISAVLYIALGTIVMTIILAAGMPVIEKLKDKNIVLQTKEVIYGIDKAIRTVISEGPGSQRTVHIDIGRGDFIIDGSTIDNDKIIWSMETKALLTQPCPGEPCTDYTIQEGKLKILTKETPVAEKYIIRLEIGYGNDGNLKFKLEEDILEDSSRTLKGRYSLIIKNEGIETGANKPIVSIKEIS